MPVYTTDGNAIQSPYSKDGNALIQAYDIGKNPLLSGTRDSFTILSYNVQWFTDLNGETNMQKEIINTYKPTLIGLQEVSRNGLTPSERSSVLGDYSVFQLSRHINYIAMASKLPLSDIVIADFVNQDPEDMSRYGETRAYMKAYFTINGKRICWINTHLAVITYSYIYAQFSELLELADNENYVVITGDFNTAFSSFDSEMYTNTYKKFVDKGYKLLSNSPKNKIVKTCGAYATKISELSTNPDTVIISGNMDISERIFDTIKFRYSGGNRAIDHIAVGATILI